MIQLKAGYDSNSTVERFADVFLDEHEANEYRRKYNLKNQGRCVINVEVRALTINDSYSIADIVVWLGLVIVIGFGLFALLDFLRGL